MQQSLPARIVGNLATFAERQWLRIIHAGGPPADWTYGAFLAHALRWSATFRQAGLQAGDRVLILPPHGIDLYASHCGALLLGAVPAMFGRPTPKHSFAEFRRSLAALRTGRSYRAMVIDEALAAELAASGGGSDLPAPLLPAALAPEPMAAAEVCRPDPVAVAILQYSSGTTGLRKGLPLTQAALGAFAEAYAGALALDPARDRIASWLPLYHDMGFIACYLVPLLSGCPVVAMSATDWVLRPELLLEQIEAARATLCWLPNFAFDFLARNVPRSRRFDLRSLRAVVNSSETVRPASLEAFYRRFRGEGLARCAIATCYGMAENTYAVTQSELGRPPLVAFADAQQLATKRRVVPRFPDDPAARAVASSGRPLAGVEIRLAARGRPVRRHRIVGEIWLRSPWTFAAYEGRGRQASGFDAQGFFRTGDLGFRYEGELFVLGRRDDTMIVAGVNVWPEDLESIASATEGIVPGRVAAFGIDDPLHGTQQIVVLAETRAPPGPARGRIQRRLHDALARAIDVPVAAVWLVDYRSLVKSTAGKISRRLNREEFAKGEAGRFGAALAKPAAAVTEDEPQGASMPADLEPVAACVAKALAAKSTALRWRLTPDLPLVTSGLLDSLSFVPLRLELEAAFGVSIGDAEGSRLERFDSIRAIAEFIRQRQATGSAITDTPAAAGPEPDDDRPAYRLPGETEVDYQEAAAKNPWLRDIFALVRTPGPPQEAIDGIGYVSPARFRSRSLTTDDQGFRTSIVDRRAVSLKQFAELEGTLGLVLGDSSAFGNGASHDRYVFPNVMNRLGAEQRVRWFNAALRAANLKGQASALRHWDFPRLSQVLLFSGSGDFHYFGHNLHGHELESGRQLAEDALIDAYRAFLDEFAREMTALVAYAKTRGLRLGFAIQVILPFTQKRPSPGDAAHFAQMRLLLGRRSYENACTALRFYWLLGRRFRADAARICHDLAVPVLDTCRLPAFNGSRPVFQDYWHYTNQGHAALVQALYDWWQRDVAAAPSPAQRRCAADG